MAMKHTAESYRVRAHILKQRDAVMNKNLINKLERKARKHRDKE